LLVYFRQEEAGRGKEHSDTHQVISELELYLYISSRGRGSRETERWRLYGDCLQVGDNQEGSQGDCRMKLETLLVQSDKNRFARKADGDNTMITEGHRHAGRKNKAKNLAEMDKELAEIRENIENIELRMQ
jgi:hypothetical protein